MQQQRNLFLFILLTMVILAGWSAFQNYMWPPPKRQPAYLTQAILPQKMEANVVAGALMAGPGGAGQILSDVMIAQYTSPEVYRIKVKPEEKTPEPEPEPKPVEIAQEAIPLGNDKDFKLNVTLSTYGGSVQQVILNDFAQATRLGLPADPPEALHLVPKNVPNPSNLLYHYADPGENHPEHPVNTLGKTNWKVAKNEKLDDGSHVVVFESVARGVLIRKTYTLKPGDYHVGLRLDFERLLDAKDSKFRYQLTSGHGLPIEGEWYTNTYRNALVGKLDSKQLWRDFQDSRTIGFQDGGMPIARGDQMILYAGIATQYFTSMIVVDNEQEEGVKPDFIAWARATVEGHHPHRERYFLDDIEMRVISESFDVKKDKPVTHKYLLYYGPVKVRDLGGLGGDRAVSPALVDRYLDTLHLNTLTDYHSPTPFGRFFSAIGWTGLIIWFTNRMHDLLGLLHMVISNYGVCIVLLTIIVRLGIFPLSRRQAIGAARMQEKMAALAPEFKKLEEKHREDPMALHQAKNELMLKSGINPLTMMGSCWMVFLQMPIFMGLYYALQESIHFRLSPFLWVQNLAAPDMLIWWTENIPIISRPADQVGFFSFLYLGPFFNILPIIAITIMFVQQKMMMPPPADEQQEMQQKMMKYMMIMMAVMFYKVAAGLCLYFITSSIWGLAERKFLPKKKSPSDAPPEDKQGRAVKPKKPDPKDSNGNGQFSKVKEMWDKLLKEAQKK